MGTQQQAKRLFGHLPPRLRLRILHGLGRYAPWESDFDFTPPPLGPGEVAGPPDFVGIGAQKAGTTWWYRLVLSHPEVSHRRGIHKERHYFDHFGDTPFTADDAARYHGWFPRTSGSMTGEWTPDYLCQPWTPPLLHRAAPGARLLVLVRDPIDRYRSGLAHDERMGTFDHARSVADARARGFYHRDIGRWLEHFDAGQLLVLQYEQCAADPVGQLARTFAFLGLDPFTPEGLRPSVHSSAEERSALDEQDRLRLVDLYRDDVDALMVRFPHLDVALWPNFA